MLGNGRRLLGGVREHHRVVRPGEGGGATEHLIGDDPQGVLVRGAAQDVVLALLRTHVFGRAHRCTGHGKAALRLGDLRDAEVRYEGVALTVEHDVGGLHVAMNDAPAAPMSVAERAAYLEQQRLNNGHLQRATSPQDSSQRRAIDVVHHEEVEVGELPDPMNVDDVGMFERGDRLGFENEPLDHGRIVEERGCDQLDRDLAAQREIASQIHGPHGSPPELAHDLEFA